MLRYRLPLLRAGRFYGSLDSKNETDMDPSEKELSVYVQHAASRDEVETSAAEPSPRPQQEQREPWVEAECAEGKPYYYSMAMDAPPLSKPDLQFPTGTTLRSIRKLRTTIAKSRPKLGRRSKQNTRSMPVSAQPPLASGMSRQSVETRDAVPVTSPVMISSRQDSISTLSHADFVVPRDLPLSLEQRNTKQRDDPNLVDLDLSFDGMSLSTAEPQAKEAAVNVSKTSPATTISSSIRRHYPTDIWSACRMGDEGFVRGALAHSPDILMQEHQGRTPLYYAAHAGHVTTVRLLLEWGATDPDGTAYLSALNKECRKLLAKAKADKPVEEVSEHPRDHIVVRPGDGKENRTNAAANRAAVSGPEAPKLGAVDAPRTRGTASPETAPADSQLSHLHESSYQSFGLDNGVSGSGVSDDDDGYMSDGSQGNETFTTNDSGQDDESLTSCESERSSRVRGRGLAQVFPASWLPEGTKRGVRLDAFPCGWHLEDVCKLL